MLLPATAIHSEKLGIYNFLYDNLILIVNSFYIVLIIFISIMSHLLWHTCTRELAGEVFFFN